MNEMNNAGKNHARNFKSASCFMLVDFSLNCTPLSPITITYYYYYHYYSIIIIIFIITIIIIIIIIIIINKSDMRFLRQSCSTVIQNQFNYFSRMKITGKWHQQEQIWIEIRGEHVNPGPLDYKISGLTIQLRVIKTISSS